MREAYWLASQFFQDYSHTCSRHDFTLPQLFACLVVREMLKLSYRKTEALLSDSMAWLADIGMSKAPDHNTLWHAFDRLVEVRQVNQMLDLLVELFAGARLLGLSIKPLSIDSTCYEVRHRSRHYDRACRKMQLGEGEKYAEKRRKTKREVNLARSRKVRAMPKLALAVSAACHVIMAARVHTGNGSDQPDFQPLLRCARKRANVRVRVVVADAGYDSEKNHRVAREQMKVRSIIPASIGRPTSKPPTTRYRRLMRQRFARKADRRHYGQRAQSETVNSMMKRNFGDALRSVAPQRREKEMLLRVLTHNIMLR